MDASHGRWRKGLTAITKEFCEQYWTSPGGNTLQNCSCTSTYHSITKTIKVRRPRYCWRSKEELISDILLFTPSRGRAKVGRSARTYIQRLCPDVRCSLEDLPGAMNDRDGWRERVREIYAGSVTYEDMIRAIHLKCFKLENKAMFCLICKWIIFGILVCAECHLPNFDMKEITMKWKLEPLTSS